jgi:hypothetical protein
MRLITDTGDSVELSPAAWQQFLQKRGGLTMPFSLITCAENVVNIDGAVRIIIQDAKEIS